MQRDEIKELHYITHLDNIPSILRRGILSHRAAQRIPHETVWEWNKPALARRANRVISDKRHLDQYANLYFCARNAMLYAIVRQKGVPCEEIAILQVAPAVLDLPGVVITERDATTDVYERQHATVNGLPKLVAGKIYADSWNHHDPYEKGKRRQQMMAEVLIPDLVPFEHISGAYVISQTVAHNLSNFAPAPKNITVLPYIFFQGPRPEHLPYLPAGSDERGSHLEMPTDHMEQPWSVAGVALATILQEITSQKYHYPIGRTSMEKIAYFATRAGIPTGLELDEWKPYGREPEGLQSLLISLTNHGFIQEYEGCMHIAEPNWALADAQLAFKDELAILQNEIERVADLFLRLPDEIDVELAAAVQHYADLLSNQRQARDMGPILEPAIVYAVAPLIPFKWHSTEDDIKVTVRTLSFLRWIDVPPVEDEWFDVDLIEEEAL